MEIFGREGWDDPEMDVYNDLDPQVNRCMKAALALP